MKKTYVNETSLNINIVADLGEINDILTVLKSADDEQNYRAKSLISKIEKLRLEAIQEARREFEDMLDKV
jgi:predicted DNA-binding ArsR family transcriptional regulator